MFLVRLAAADAVRAEPLAVGVARLRPRVAAAFDERHAADPEAPGDARDEAARRERREPQPPERFEAAVEVAARGRARDAQGDGHAQHEEAQRSVGVVVHVEERVDDEARARDARDAVAEPRPPPLARVEHAHGEQEDRGGGAAPEAHGLEAPRADHVPDADAHAREERDEAGDDGGERRPDDEVRGEGRGLVRRRRGARLVPGFRRRRRARRR
mmetsp:Transcript_22462/g.73321  ORF Transcript_22462/g.73321 Transcript_22462/m.73321 type:complete len:214 (+) Transcript_22462:1733-2374(+)